MAEREAARKKAEEDATEVARVAAEEQGAMRCSEISVAQRISLHRRMHYPPGDFLPRHDSARLAAESEASGRAFEKEQTQIEEEAARREEEAAVAAAAAAKAEDEAIERCMDP